MPRGVYERKEVNNFKREAEIFSNAIKKPSWKELCISAKDQLTATQVQLETAKIDIAKLRENLDSEEETSRVLRLDLKIAEEKIGELSKELVELVDTRKYQTAVIKTFKESIRIMIQEIKK